MEEIAVTEVPQTQYTVIRTAARVRFYPFFVKKLRKRGPLSGGTCKWTVMICWQTACTNTPWNQSRFWMMGARCLTSVRGFSVPITSFVRSQNGSRIVIYYAMWHKNVNPLNCSLQARSIVEGWGCCPHFMSHQTFFLNWYIKKVTISVEPPSPDKDFHYFG